MLYLWFPLVEPFPWATLDGADTLRLSSGVEVAVGVRKLLLLESMLPFLAEFGVPGDSVDSELFLLFQDLRLFPLLEGDDFSLGVAFFSPSLTEDRMEEMSELERKGLLSLRTGWMLSERRGVPPPALGDGIGLCVLGVTDFTRRILRVVPPSSSYSTVYT